MGNHYGGYHLKEMTVNSFHFSAEKLQGFKLSVLCVLKLKHLFLKK